MNNLFYIIFILIFFVSCSDVRKQAMPMPTEKTAVKKDMEEGDKGDRKLWLEMVHGGKFSDWQNTEYINQLNGLEYQRSLPGANRDGEEWVADGKVYGKWVERGSNNQAGSALNAFYDKDSDKLYALGAGGPLFVGDLYGSQWTIVNDDYRFDGSLLEIISLPNGHKRMIGAINGVPHYSDNLGKDWTKSAGVANASDGRDVYSGFQINNVVFCVAKKDWWSDYILYKSNDGVQYTAIKNFGTNDGRLFDINLATDKTSLYTAEYLTPSIMKISKYNAETQKMEVVNDAVPFNFGGNGKTNLDVVIQNNDTLFYAYNEINAFYRSNDKGQTWTYLSGLLSTPWNVGVYIVPSDPTRMLYGEVDGFRGNNSGKSWNRINNWYDYYDNVRFMLHADIMFIKEFKDQFNEDIVIIGHHGGISVTKDYGETTENITLFDFNVSQYYDVKSDPNDPSVIYAGSQDQGMQRGTASDDLTADFYQMISGDYGHITFTGNGEHMWIVYPGGSISFYNSPRSSSWPNLGYEIQYGRESVWIPPLIADPHEQNDVIYAAGGSANAQDNGSYIIKLEVKSGAIQAQNLPFDFSVSGGVVSAMAISPLDKNLWFAATDNGKVYKSTDRGQSFKQVATMLSGAHYLYGSCIYPSKTDVNLVYLTGSGYGNVAPVYVSKNAGDSFQSMRTGMPSTLAFELVANEDESKLFAATEAGPYVYLQTEGRWYPLAGTNTPNQTYWSVEYINTEKTARFGTYGRGIWDFRDLSVETNTNEPVAARHINIYPLPAKEELNIESKTFIHKIQLYTLQGQLVKSLNNPGNTISLYGLPVGQYVMQIFTKKNKITKSIIKI